MRVDTPKGVLLNTYIYLCANAVDLGTTNNEETMVLTRIVLYQYTALVKVHTVMQRLARILYV